MENNQHKRLLLEHLVELLELPESAYQKAEERYKDLGYWLSRKESVCAKHEPHIFPQGSFRLGTAIRPLDEKEEYDLDLACRLRVGITKQTHTQQALKKLVGNEIETYRVARGIKAPKEEKHRCWRLEYADKISFHMDIVPCIPADESRRKTVLGMMTKFGENEAVAVAASQLTVSITDDRHSGYMQICEDWNISNPEGYALWFESRMKQARQVFIEKAQIDEIPLYKQKSPLQRSIQLLKRHRDQMFKNDPDVKPISIIITTLATRAYQGEANIELALRNILMNMGSFVNSKSPRVPNPVDPNEDFADRWSMPQYKHLNLEKNFWNWLKQVQNDFGLISSSDNMDFVTEQAKQKFSVSMDAVNLSNRLGLVYTNPTMVSKSHIITEPPKPWGMEE